MTSGARSRLSIGVVSGVESSRGVVDGLTSSADVPSGTVTSERFRSNFTILARRTINTVANYLSVLERVVSSCRAVRHGMSVTSGAVLAFWAWNRGLEATGRAFESSKTCITSDLTSSVLVGSSNTRNLNGGSTSSV